MSVSLSNLYSLLDIYVDILPRPFSVHQDGQAGWAYCRSGRYSFDLYKIDPHSKRLNKQRQHLKHRMEIRCEIKVLKLQLLPRRNTFFRVFIFLVS